MAKTFTSHGEAPFGNMLTTSDKVAGEVIELENWEIPIESAAQVVAAFATDKQRYMNARALVYDAANRYRIDVVASQYVRLFERNRDGQRLSIQGAPPLTSSTS